MSRGPVPRATIMLRYPREATYLFPRSRVSDYTSSSNDLRFADEELLLSAKEYLLDA
jgi:hypothetical protein